MCVRYKTWLQKHFQRQREGDRDSDREIEKVREETEKDFVNIKLKTDLKILRMFSSENEEERETKEKKLSKRFINSWAWKGGLLL